MPTEVYVLSLLFCCTFFAFITVYCANTRWQEAGAGDTRNRFRFLNAEQFGTILVGRIGRMLSLRTVQEVLASVCSTPTDFHRRGDVSAVRASV